MKVRLLFLRAWVSQHASSMAFAGGLLGVIALFLLNPGVLHTPTWGKVVSVTGNPSSYQSTDTFLIVELPDGRVTSVGLLDGTIPPAQGTVVNLWRVRRLIFGEYFLIAELPRPSTPKAEQ